MLSVAALLGLILCPSNLLAQGAMFDDFVKSNPKVGDVPPDFTLETLDGTEFTLSEAYATQPVVIEFGSFT
jgi:cytochrome oxidase Cu insertion factor (SCO1/SenC/PrrC family)